MAIFDSFTKKSKLDAAVKKAAKARSETDSIQDQLLKEVYQDYADVLTGDSLRAAALYQWGVTLLHQAKSKTPPESINIYRNAIAKFSFCMTIEPNYLAAAIDAGVACMDLARARNVPTTDELYEMAKKQFEKANSIQAGVAAYNLACIYGLRDDHENCLEALKLAKDKGNLPDREDIFNDQDMATVTNQDWFVGFFDKIDEDKRLEEERKQAEKAAIEAAKLAEKEREANKYDPYKPKNKTTEAEKVKPEEALEKTSEIKSEDVSEVSTKQELNESSEISQDLKP